MSEKTTAFRVERTFDALRIYAGSVLHIHLPAKDLAFQSWFETGRFVIEYTLHTGAMVTTEYDSKSKFETVLRGLEKEFRR